MVVAGSAVVATAGYTASGFLVSKAYRCQGSGCLTATGGSQVTLVRQYSAAKQHLPSHKNSTYCHTILPSVLPHGESWGRVLAPSLSCLTSILPRTGLRLQHRIRRYTLAGEP